MKNVTVTLDADLVRRARIEAAKEGKSLSKFLAGLVEARLGRTMSQKEAFDALMKLGPMNRSEGGKLPSRKELYDERADQLLRGHQRPVVSDGRGQSGKTRTGKKVA